MVTESLQLKKIKNKLLLLALCLASSISFSQIDSLENVLPTLKEDSTKVNTLILLGKQYRNASNYPKSLANCGEAIDLSRKLGLKKQEAQSLNLRGITYNNMRKMAEALEDFLAAMKIREKLGDKEGISSIYMGIGSAYAYMSKEDIAIENYQKGLKIAEEIKDEANIAHAHLLMGNVYIDRKEWDKALESFDKTLASSIRRNSKTGIASSINNIGIVHELSGDYEAALKNFNKALPLYLEIGNKDAIAGCYLNLGQTNVYLKNYSEAKKYFDMGLALSKEIGNMAWMREGYSGMTGLDTSVGDYKRAFWDFRKHIEYRDSVNNKQNSEKMIQLQMQYDFDKQLEAEKLQQEIKDGQTAEAARRQRLMIGAVSLVLLIVIGFSGMLLKRVRLIRSQKAIIEEKNRSITDSINYAKRIQQSQMSTEKYIEKTLNRLMNK